MATEEQLLQGLKAADTAGNTADAQHFADQIKAMRAAPAQAAAQPDQSFMGRLKNAVFAPEGERDPSLLSAVANGIVGVPGQIWSDMKRGGAAIAENAPEMVNTRETDIGKLNRATVGAAGGLAGIVFSPLTGTLSSVLGRPFEQQTGIRREITGDIASAFVPLAGPAKTVERIEKANAALKPGALEAHAAGYVLPPNMISKKPGIFAKALSGISGKVKTVQVAAEKNQEVTNAIVAKDLGIPEGVQLSEEVFRGVRAQAGKAYEAVKSAVPNVAEDDHYLEQVKSLGGANSDAAAHFPNTMKNQGIKDLVEELSSVPEFPTGAGMELVKELRSSATANLKAIGDRSKHMLGLAQRQAADAVDGLIERNIERAGGDPAIVKAYKDARQLIAKSYDVQGATNEATGDVNALGLARLANKGKPMTGGLGVVAKTAQAFPQAMKTGVVTEPVSTMDFFGAALLAAHGNPKMAGMMLARPVARKTIFTDAGQNAFYGAAHIPDANALSVSPKLRRAPAANALTQLTQQPQN